MQFAILTTSYPHKISMSSFVSDTSIIITSIHTYINRNSMNNFLINLILLITKVLISAINRKLDPMGLMLDACNCYQTLMHQWSKSTAE